MEQDKIMKYYKEYYKDVLEILKKSTRICKYSDIVSTKKDGISNRKYKHIECLKDKKVLYYFKHNAKGIIYIGECHINNEKWSAINRLKQHFQPSQKSGLLGKIINIEEKSEHDAIEYLKDIEIYYIDLTDKNTYFIKAIEAFCIDCYDPTYNK